VAAVDVAHYIGVMAALGEDFEARADLPWARKILENPYMDARTKITCLDEHAIAHDDARAGGG
jgi:hypothetical protein